MGLLPGYGDSSISFEGKTGFAGHRRALGMLKRTRAPEVRKRPVITVMGLSTSVRQGVLRLGVLNLPCSLGRGGRSFRKREGDGRTPVGRWRLLRVLYRADRIPRPLTGLPVMAIGRHDGWCDAPNDPNYNRPVHLPYGASAEALWRSDGLYDVVVVLSHNIRPRVRGLGSAIFMHVARPDCGPTEGCVALRREHLLAVLRHLRPGAVIQVLP
jgi:L,D-peptidoglycan transpeptidase YkuD (ErfK/YbiS/YcfS/YnhG family)